MPLHPSMGASAYIHDFVHSKNPKFKGKSKKKRIQMALGAFYGAKNFHGREDVNPIVVDSPVLSTLGEIEAEEDDLLERDTTDLDFKVQPLKVGDRRISSTVNGRQYHHFPERGMTPSSYYNRIMSIYALSPEKALQYMQRNSRYSRKVMPLHPKLSDVGY